MKFVSTNNSSPAVGLEDAVGSCLAPDGGLYMPAEIPVIPRAFFNNIEGMSLADIAFVVATAFIGDDIPSAELKGIVDNAFAFDAPFRRIDKDTYVLELFHGPTLTCKDYAARFMAGILRYLDGGKNRRRNILVATTGNTGAAAANAFCSVPGVNVTVLYPKGKLPRQRTAYFTSLGENIYPVEVMGTVEDCKTLMEQAMADPAMGSFNLTGANSINVTRLIPQISYALYAYAHLKALEIEEADQALYSIPCGNLSNLVATAIAHRMGLPCGKIIAAMNGNNQLGDLMHGSVPRSYSPTPSLAPSIDMVYPSGWPRLRALYNDNPEAMLGDIDAPQAVSDLEIETTIRNIYHSCGYALDPHTAVALVAANRPEYDGRLKVIMATGHPAKDIALTARITGTAPELPDQLTRFKNDKRHPVIIPPTMPALKKHLTNITNG